MYIETDKDGKFSKYVDKFHSSWNRPRYTYKDLAKKQFDDIKSDCQTSSYWWGSEFNAPRNRGFNIINSNSCDLIAMASYKRSIANFVKILTGKDYRVIFNALGDSKTDGKTVIISADMSSNDFDSTVGLALHEASHLLLSNFSILTTFQNLNNDKVRRYTNNLRQTNNELYTSICSPTALSTFYDTLKNVLNIIEDRRIDAYVYTNAPGYQGYYNALYTKYFNTKSIDTELRNPVHTSTPSYNSYLFHLANLVNPNYNVNTLPGLKEITKLIDLDNISRLGSTEDALDVSIAVMDIIIRNIHASEKKSSKDNKQTQNSAQPSKQDSGSERSSQSENKDTSNSKESSKSDSKSNSNNVPENTELPDNNKDSNEKESKEKLDGDKSASAGNSKSENNTPAGNKPKLSNQELTNTINKIKDFLSGQIDKGQALTSEQSKSVELVANSNVNYVDIDGGMITNGNNLYKKIISISGINESILKTMPDNYNSVGQYDNAVRAGIVLGKLLGRKLQITNESRTLKTTRLTQGRIEKRLINSLGYECENVFSSTVTERFKPSLIHLSIDLSGSMQGDKFEKSIKTAAAIATAAKMNKSLDVIISMRGNASALLTGGNGLPVMWSVYDSRKDDISVIRKYLGKLKPSGSTPEGLCLEGYMKQFRVEDATKYDLYFVNICDGMPEFGSYSGTKAFTHTNKMVKQLRSFGYNILGYYVESESGLMTQQRSTNNFNNFKTMYGQKTSFKINLSSLNDLAKTLNNMFLNKTAITC